MKLLKYLIIFLVLSSSTQSIYAKKASKCSFYGQVIDKNTKEPLAGVKIYLKELKKSVYTDFDGKFLLGNVKSGIYSVNLSLISYDESDITLNINDFSNSKKSLTLSSR